jgi:hypothetical protein
MDAHKWTHKGTLVNGRTIAQKWIIPVTPYLIHYCAVVRPLTSVPLWAAWIIPVTPGNALLLLLLVILAVEGR